MFDFYVFFTINNLFEKLMFLRDLIFSQYIVDTYISVSYDFFTKNLFIFQLVFNVIFCKYNYALLMHS